MEIGTDGLECPDVIGWDHGGSSWLIEVKVSRPDFLADRKKVFQGESTLALGNFRVYITPPGLVKPTEVPVGWGLAEVRPKTVRFLVEPTRFELVASTHRREKRLMVSAFKRATEGWGQKVLGAHLENEEIDGDPVTETDPDL